MKIFLIFAAIAALALGGGFYYLGIHQPSQFAKAFLAFAQEIESAPSDITRPTLRGSYDFDGAIAAFERQRQFVTQLKTRVEAIQPPRVNEDMKRMHENAAGMFGAAFSAINDNEQRLLFAQKAVNLLNILRPDSSTVREAMPPPTTRPLPPNPNTVGEVLEYLGSFALEEAKSAGSYLFQTEPPDLGSPSFAELKQAWGEALRGMEATIQYFSTLDRSTPLSSLPPQSEIAKQIPDAIYADRMDDFANMLESSIIHNSPERLVSSFTQSEEVSRRSEQFGRDIETLRAKYR